MTTPDAEQPRSLIKPGGGVDVEYLREIAEREAESEGDVDLGFDPDSPRKVAFPISRDHGQRLDKYLNVRLTHMSRTQIQGVIERELVRVSGRIPKASTKLRPGDLVEVVVPPPPPTNIQPEDIPLDVIFEDEHLIVVSKQPDIIVHPARAHNRGTMLNALAWHLQHASSVGGELSDVGRDQARPGVVHRLDRDTTGVIVFAKTEEAHWKLGRQFEKRETDKRYLALVAGDLQPLADVIDLPLGPSPSKIKGRREKQVVRHDELGKPAVTIYRVRERFDGYSLVEVELKTGRTHQIRVHLSHRGFPIVGDDMYDGPRPLGADLGLPETHPDAAARWDRQLLHAATLAFTHPITTQPMTFAAPIPADFRRLLGILRRNRPGAGRTDIAGATLDLDAVIPAD
jgi:23S rRNA pseudouridine1911/1915/1917 synthase